MGFFGRDCFGWSWFLVFCGVCMNKLVRHCGYCGFPLKSFQTKFCCRAHFRAFEKEYTRSGSLTHHSYEAVRRAPSEDNGCLYSTPENWDFVLEKKKLKIKNRLD